MTKKLFQRLLYKAGKNYTVDPDIPDSLIRGILYQRIIMLVRGYIKLGKKVYVGKSCCISNKRNIEIGSSVTIGHHTKIDGYAREKVYIGEGSSIGPYSTISCTSHLSKFGKGFYMGRNSAIGQFTEFGAAGGIEI